MRRAPAGSKVARPRPDACRRLVGVCAWLLLLVPVIAQAGEGIAASLDAPPAQDDKINAPAQHKWAWNGANEIGGERDSRSPELNFWAQPNLEGTFRLAPEWNTGFRFDMRLRWDSVNVDYKMSTELWLTLYGMRFRRGQHRLRLYLVNRVAIGDKTALITQVDANYIWFFGSKDKPHSIDVRLVGGLEEKFSPDRFGHYSWLRLRLSLQLSKSRLQPTLLLPLRVVTRGEGYTPDLKTLSFIFEPALDTGSFQPGASIEVRANDGSYIVGLFLGRRY